MLITKTDLQVDYPLASEIQTFLMKKKKSLKNLSVV